MKIARIIALLLVAVMALGIFAACNEEPAPVDPNAPPKALKISEIYKEGVDMVAIEQALGYGDNLYSSVEDFTALDGKNIVEKSGSLMYYLNANVDPAKYTVYNIETATDLVTFTVESFVDIEFDDVFFTVMTYETASNTSKSTVYNLKGEKLFETFGSYEPDEIANGYYRIGNAIYKETYNDELVKVADVPMFFDVDFDELYPIEGGFVAINDYVIAYYDSAFNPVTEYEVPGYYDDVDISILADGKAFIFATIEEDVYGDTYDVIVQHEEYVAGEYVTVTEKLTIDYLLFNQKDGSVTALTGLDGYFIEDELMNAVTYTDEMPVGFYDIYNTGIVNIAYAAKITNKRIDNSLPVVLNIDNDGNIKGQLNAQVANQEFEPSHAGDYYMVSTPSTTYILNKDGSVVKKFATDYLYEGKYGYYDSYAKIVYNKNFEPIKDLSAYEVQNYYNDYILYCNYDANGKKNYFVWSDAGEKQIALTANEIITSYSEVDYDGLYKLTIENTEDGTTKYRYYNYQGTLLFESNYSYSTYVYGDNFVIISASDWVDGAYKTYYKKIK